ncbi:hypothetical protein TrRE_jg784, partial [Triparma retinervis]
RFVPGPLFEGPVTPAGNTPIYKANGMTCYIITLLTTLIIDLTGSFNLSKVHSEFGEIIYITKFFHWEMGYMCSMDIQVDRAGYYLCWGCLVWVPCVYTSAAYYLALHSPPLSPPLALSIFCCGVLAIFLNYDADSQRSLFRRTGGSCTINRQAPTFIRASYLTGEGRVRTNLLLTSGWWGVAKHVGYSFEVLSSLLWSLPAGLPKDRGALLAPYFYVAFLAVLLTDRAFRDDDRCRKKYGEDWEKYDKVVKYKIIPGII